MANGFQDKSDAELVSTLFTRERELVGARFKHSTGQLENTASVGGLRRQIARIKTELRARELTQGLGRDGLIAAHRGASDGGPSDQVNPARGGFLAGIVDKVSSND